MIASLQLSSVNSSVISSPFVMSPEAMSPETMSPTSYSPGSITPPYKALGGGSHSHMMEQISAKVINMYFRPKFGLVNSVNTYLSLRFVLCGENLEP